jgi:hypothetical protein
MNLLIDLMVAVRIALSNMLYFREADVLNKGSFT